MKYCTYCGNELFDEAVICMKCGCPVRPAQPAVTQASVYLLSELAKRLKTNGIIWIVIGVLQIFMGMTTLFLEDYLTPIFLMAVGVLNIVSATKDIKYSSELIYAPAGIVQKFEPVTGPIITMAYNLIFGGVIGVVGSIYYFVGLRGFVMENKNAFLAYDYYPYNRVL